MRTLINKILEEWAYRVHDGMPNPKNPLHIVHLKESMEWLQIPETVIDGFVNNLTEGEEWWSKLSPEEQAKYIWVESGAILDIVINIQPDSKDYKKHIIVELNDQNNCHLFIPKGFAHGFISIHDNSKVCYVVDNFYSSKHDSGINYKDESLEIEWPINVNDLIVSEKDQNLPFL